MKLAHWVLIALAAALLPLFTSVPANASDFILLAQADPTVDLIGAELFVPAGLDRQTPSQNGLAALVAECILQTSVGAPAGERVTLRDAVDAEGGSIDYALDGQNVRFYLEGLGLTYSRALLPAFRRALAAPDFGEAARKAARLELRRRMDADAVNTLAVALGMLGPAFYGDSDAGLPQFGTVAAQLQFTGEDARAFFVAHYRRGGAVLSAAGNVGSLGAGDLRTLVEALREGSSPVAFVHPRPLSGTSRQVVAHRDVALPWLVAQYHAPGIDSPDFGAMLVLTAFMSRTLSERAEIPSVSVLDPAQKTTGAMYRFDTQPASVVLSIDGGLGDPSRTFATAVAIANVLKRVRIERGMNLLRAGALGYFTSRTATLEERARVAGIFALHGSGADYFKRVSAAIAKTTASDVQRAAKRYLTHPTVALVLPRGAPGPAL